MPNRIKLGTIVQDRVTGLQGVAVCRTEYLTGCTRVGVQPKGTQKDGAMGKATFVGLLGLPGAKAKAQALVNQAVTALSGFGDEANTLRDAARYMVARKF